MNTFPPETALVIAARAGDRAAFGMLYQRFARMVHGVLLAHVPRQHVDDLVQDVFLMALGRLQTLRDPAAFGGWIVESSCCASGWDGPKAARRPGPDGSTTTMSDEYLWDKTGEPDLGVEELERTLAPLAHDGRALELPATPPPAVARPRALWRNAPRWALAAASIAVVAGAATWWTFRSSGEAWTVTRISGAPRVGMTRMGPTARMAVGQWLVTDAGSRARLEVGEIGEVTLEPDSRLRLVRASADDHRLALQRGMLRALIFAPPRRFTVETPAASAVDLGCAYTLEVADDGRSVVTVESGWVSFERDGREAFIPAGARSVTFKGGDPGTPYFIDADPRFIEALDAVDRTSRGGAHRDAALASALAAARREDALTLWHLLARLDGDARLAVFTRLAVLAPPPPGVSRDGVLRGDRAMLDAWWNSLGLGDVDWWRLWAQSPPESRG